MRCYLLDTNVNSDLIRHPRGAVWSWLEEVSNEQIATSIIVAAQLRLGAAKKRSPALEAKVEEMLGSLSVLPLDEPADRAYGQLRASLESAGTPISNNDMLIAAHALALGAVLVTDNVGEFSRIDGLAVENWLR